ncbi:MAG: PASTA domain-containing protein [candidate division NC10 bacterium]|nr:PASTA domain-containing protein [candidate division NC10 bacterium]
MKRRSRFMRVWRGFLKGLKALVLLLSVALISAFITMQLALERDKVLVPDVVGQGSEAAIQGLKALGLKPLVIRKEYHDEIPMGAVIAQRPSGGARIRKGSEVKLVVSRGTDKVMVPALAGLDLEQAGWALTEAGLLRGRVAKVHSDGYPEGQVIAQDPPAGSVVKQRSPVQLLLSLGPLEEPAPFPPPSDQEVP